MSCQYEDLAHEEYDEEDDSEEEEQPRKKGTDCKPLNKHQKIAYGSGCCCCCCTSLVLSVLFVILPAILGFFMVEQHCRWAESLYANCPGYPTEVQQCESGDFLTPQNGTRYMTWGGCSAGFKTDADFTACGMPCISPTLITEVDKFNKAHDFKYVSFPSRQHPTAPTVQITAWWLPSGIPGAPRIVLQHGNNANFNSRYAYLGAYLLRSMGFDTLIHSLRNHGSSGKSEPFKTTWGYEFPYDLLGAWDFLVNDPQSILGGAVDASRVGIQGYSMGGFIVQSAFGIEPRVPAAWTDGAVFDLGAEAGAQVGGYIGKPLGSLVGKLSVRWMDFFAGVAVTEFEPRATLSKGPDTRRPVAVTTSTLDTFVPLEQTDMLRDFLESYPAKYNVSNYRWATTCNNNAHCSEEMAGTNEYREKLCEFWTRVFGLTYQSCGLDKLPAFSNGYPAAQFVI